MFCPEPLAKSARPCQQRPLHGLRNVGSDHLTRYCANRGRDLGGMVRRRSWTDLLDEGGGTLWPPRVLASDDLVELFGEGFKIGGVGRCVRVFGEAAVEPRLPCSRRF